MSRTPPSPDPEPRRQSKVADAFDRFLAEQEEQRQFHEEMKQLMSALVVPQDKDDTK